MFNKKGKGGKDGTPEKPGKGAKGKQPTTEPKSPRVDDGGSGGQGVVGGGGDVPVDDGIISFTLGDTRLGLTHKKLLGDTTFFDTEIMLGGAHKKTAPQRAHRAVLQVRCPALLGDKVCKLDKKKDKWTTTVSEAALPTLSPVVLGQLMVFVYSGSMEVQRFSLPTLLDMAAVGSALQLDEVVWLCEHRVRELLNIESVHSILKGAEDRQLLGVKNFALEYSFAHWNEFIGNQEGAKILGLELIQDVSSKYAKGERPTYPERPQPPNTIISDYRRMFEEMPHADMHIEVGNEKLPCHRAVLAMYSDALANRFKTHLKPGVAIRLVDVEHPSLDVQSPNAVLSLLRFVYYGETKMDPIDACEMIHKVNSVYKLNTFQFLCEHTIINNINARSVIPILGVCYIKGLDSKPHMQALKKQTLAFIISHFATVDLGALSTMPPEIRTDLLLSLQAAFKAGKLGAPYEAGNLSAGRFNEDEPAVAVDSSD